MQTILSLVASEMGVSILPKSAAELGIKLAMGGNLLSPGEISRCKHDCGSPN